MVRKFGEGVPARVSFSSSDRGSKFRGPSQNNTRVVSKRDVNITKLTQLKFNATSPMTHSHHLSDSDYCNCGGIGTALHYVTECILTVFWYMRKPVPNFEQDWLKTVANNVVSRRKIRRIVKFISENRYLFRPL
ncbi:hypothetical protein AVEN_69726-1 [Araneus ventricosus]|uniref:PiggyBac transposable element-derived protein domain-containing protein n=1 Tax=Araneus ventricosus TaxID=182803 RepID=A0A4Y2UGA5_ARAVE|nr:hypothetical protein AVEN_69726-1 [Araneus ventricosus]